MTMFKNHWLILFLTVWLGSCGISSALVTMDSFQDVPVGASSSEVVEMLGEPYAIHKKSDGAMEYEYIERLSAGSRDFRERHYFLLLKDDRVVSRRVQFGAPAPYHFDSYEMQTTQNQASF